MFRQWYPDEMFDSAFAIDYQAFFDRGYRGVLFDTDNTIVGHDAPADDRACRMIASIKRIGFKVCIISNNNENRVRPFATAVGADYVCDAGKPKGSGFLRAMDMMGLEKEEIMMVGDQLFTDIWGAKRAGVLAVFVGPVDKEILFRIKLKRIGEKVVLFVKRVKEGK